MPFIENLVEGLASAAGAEHAVGEIEKRKQRRQQMDDYQLEFKTQNLLNNMQGLNERRSKLDPNSATYQSDMSQIDQQMRSAQQAFTDLYHPQQNPGALQKLGGILRRRVPQRFGGTKGKPPATPAAARESYEQRMGEIGRVAYAPIPGSDNVTKFNRWVQDYTTTQGSPPDETQKARAWEHISMGAPFEQKPSGKNLKQYQTTGPDGKPQYAWFDATDPDNIPEGWTAVPTRSAPGEKPPTANQISMEAYENAYQPPVKWAQMTPEQKAFYPRWKAMQTDAISSNQYVLPETQPNGQIKAIIVQRTTEKTHPQESFPSGYRQPGQPAAAPAPTPAPASTPPATPAPGTAPNVPKTPAQAGNKPKPKAGVVAEGPIIGGKESPERKAFNTTVGLVALAEDVAAKPDDAVNQKRLAVALERQAAGRFTTQALDYVMKAGWGNTIQQWINNPTTGALPPDIVRQLVDGAYQTYDASLASLETSGGEMPKVKMRSPDGSTTQSVPADQVSHYRALGARVVP